MFARQHSARLIGPPQYNHKTLLLRSLIHPCLALLLQMVRLMTLTKLEELTLSSVTVKPKAMDITAMPRALQRLAYHSPASFIHLVSPLWPPMYVVLCLFATPRRASINLRLGVVRMRSDWGCRCQRMGRPHS